MDRVPRTDKEILWSSKAAQSHSMLCERKSQALDGRRKAKIMQSPQSEKQAQEEKKIYNWASRGNRRLGFGVPQSIRR